MAATKIPPWRKNIEKHFAEARDTAHYTVPRDAIPDVDETGVR
jgi:hypothetical protein